MVSIVLQKKNELDSNELNNLLNQATRENVKRFLRTQLDALKSDSDKLRKTEQERVARLSSVQISGSTYTKKM